MYPFIDMKLHLWQQMSIGGYFSMTPTLRWADESVGMQLFKPQKLFLLLLCLSQLTGCRTFDDFYNGSVGEPISRFENIADAPTPTKEQAANGNTVYAFRLKYQKDCTVFFEVNNQGIIVSWWHKGVCLAHEFGIN